MLSQLSVVRSLVFAAVVALAGSAVADDNFVWRAETGADNTTATLWYGVPESDNMQFMATCSTASDAGFLMALFGADMQGSRDGDRSSVDVSVGKFVQRLPGKVFGTQQQDGLAGIRAEILLDSPLWAALRSGKAIAYSARNGKALKMSLRSIKQPLSKFLADCESIASTGTTGAKAADDAGGEDEAGSGQIGQAVSETKVAYTCSDEGAPMTVTYRQNGNTSVAIVTHELSGTVTLKQAISGSGARYTDGTYELFSKGKEALFIWGDGQQTCTED